jgi:hypothetical protein
MPKAIRQDNLYGAEDWSIIYTSFKNAEFVSYDFDTLRDSMLNYMQVNYPEEFNDYTQNSEFIALLDLVAYVGQNLAFRMDLNARENILDTAEKRESVLRIARMLSYKPKRIRAAQGLLKVTSVQTSEQILDSTGQSLANKVVMWGSDPSELEYERFIRIINSAFADNNKFGTPVKRSVNTDNANIFEIYNFNNVNLITNYPVGVAADGANLNFDLLPVDINTDGFIDQSEPDFNNAFSILYRNDGRGTGSTKTGFFVFAKQGFISSNVQYISDPAANIVVNLDQTANATEDDYFVQTVDETGAVIKSWTRVPNLDFNNITLNDLTGSNKDLYEVIYSDNDVTSIKFGDGTFSNVPTGFIRVWYRNAENQFIKVKPQDITSVDFEIQYVNADNQTHTLLMSLQLQDNMVTGIPAETVDEIKNNAPEAFYSKNRMVTGDDYNGLLPTLNNDVLIMKAENRTFSGHSRYVDLKDPTGRNRPLIEFADDGYFYRTEYQRNIFIPDDPARRTVDLLDEFIENKLNDIALVNFYYGKLNLLDATDTKLFPLVKLGKTTHSTTLSVAIPATGQITTITVANIAIATDPYNGFDANGGLLQIDNELFTYDSVTTVGVTHTFNSVRRAAQRSTAAAHSVGTSVFKVLDYRWRVAYNDLNSSNGFISESNANESPVKVGYTTAGPLRIVRPGSFIKFEYGPGDEYRWAAVLDIKGDGLGIQDENYDYTGLLVNGMGPIEINRSVTDTLDVLPEEDDPTTYRLASIIPAFPRVFDDNSRVQLLDLLENKQSFAIKFNNLEPKWEVITDAIDLYSDFDTASTETNWLMALDYRNNEGYILTLRQLDYVFGSEELLRFYNINFAASFNPGFKPLSDDTIKILTLNSSNKLAEQQSYRISGYYVYDDGYTDSSKVKVTPLDVDNDFLPDDPMHFINLVNSDTVKFVHYDEGDFTYLVPDQTAAAGDVVQTLSGTTNLAFKWHHKVDIDQTLDPSLTNIIDVYVLTKTYNDDFQIWKKKNNATLSMPLPPTTEEIRGNFRDLLSYKMMTDEVIFHPVKFKPLFGKLADIEFQAQLKVVKNPKSKLTDNEVKSKVIAAIDKFFTPGNFGFGETFYFTELAAYIHTSLNVDLNSVVLVPIGTESKFGTLFQIQPDRNEIVTSVATVNDVIVINEITDNNIRIGK